MRASDRPPRGRDRPRRRGVPRTRAGAAVAAGLIGAGVGVVVGYAADLGGDEPAPAVRARSPAPTPPALPATTASEVPPAAPAAWVDGRRLRAAVERVAAGDEVGVALRSLATGHVVTVGPLQTAPAWSTIKVPIVVARYRLAASRREDTREVDRFAEAALTASDNDAAEALFAGIADAEGGVGPASRYVERVLRDAGDSTTTVNDRRMRPEFSTYGQTAWSLVEGTRFFRALANGCFEPLGGSAKVLELLRNVVPAQRWGVGRAALAQGTTAALKGGWGPGRDGRYVVRQFAIVRSRAGGGFVLGTLAVARDGGFERGIEVNDRLADAAVAAVRGDAAPAERPCR